MRNGIALFAFVILSCASSGDRDAALQREQVDAAKRGWDALATGDFATAEAQFTRIATINPADDAALYLIAVAQDHQKQPDRAVASLGSLAKVSCLVARRQSFVNTPAAAQFAAPRLAPASRVAFSIAQPDLLPEGIAFDPAGKQFFVSSTRHRKIVRVRMTANGAVASDFVPDAFEGLRSVLGLKVANGELWAVSVGDRDMNGYQESDEGRTAVYRFSIGDGRLIRVYEPPDAAKHYFNDLVVAPDGAVYVTDSLTGAIYVIRDDVREFVPAGTFSLPNGITVSPDGRILYVGDTRTGTFAMRIDDRVPHLLWHRGQIGTEAVDGLYFHDGNLIAVENAISNGRVVRFRLTKDRMHLAATEVLDCADPRFDDPTTGTVVGDSLFYIANSQFRRTDGNFKPTDVLERSLK